MKTRTYAQYNLVIILSTCSNALIQIAIRFLLPGFGFLSSVHQFQLANWKHQWLDGGACCDKPCTPSWGYLLSSTIAMMTAWPPQIFVFIRNVKRNICSSWGAKRSLYIIWPLPILHILDVHDVCITFLEGNLVSSFSISFPKSNSTYHEKL